MSRDVIARIRADLRQLEKDLPKGRRRFQLFGKKIGRDLRSSLRGAFRTVGTIGGIGGAAGLIAAGKGVIDFEDKLDRLGIQAKFGSEAVVALRKQIRNLSDDGGEAADNILAGANQLVNLEGGAALTSDRLELLDKAMVATGASGEDLARVLFSLDKTAGVSSVKDQTLALNALTAAGKEASIPLDQLGAELPKVLPQFVKFGRKGAAGIAQLGAALQVTAQGFKGPKELFTGANEALFQLAKQSGKLKKLGINVFEAKRGPHGERVYRDLRDIITDIGKSKLAKDDKLLIDAFGSKEAAQFLGLLVKNTDQWDALYDASLKADVLQEDYVKRTTGRAGRLRRSWQRIQNSIAKAFTPERIEKFAQLMERVADLVGYLAEHAEAVGVAIAAWKLRGPALAFLKLLSDVRGAGGIKAFLAANAAGAGAESAAAGAAAGGSGKAAAATGILSTVNIVAALATQLSSDQAGPSKKEALANLNALIYSRSQDANLGLSALAEKYQYNIHGKSLKELQAFASAYQYGGAGGLDSGSGTRVRGYSAPAAERTLVGDLRDAIESASFGTLTIRLDPDGTARVERDRAQRVRVQP